MKIYLSRKGMTLTELIVATILIAIIMVAVASFSSGVKALQKSSSRMSDLTMKLSTAMFQLKRDAMLTTGSGQGNYNASSNPNSGIFLNVSGFTKTICFRHDQSDPSIYSDDKWVCYINCRIAGFDRCEGLSAPTTSCPTASRERFLGMPSNEFFTVQCDSGDNATCSGAIKYIDFFLSTKKEHGFDNYEDPIKNPEFSLTTRVYPLGHSQ